MAQRSPSRAQQSAPAEVLSSLNLGFNTYTDPTLQTPRQWAAASNVYSGAYGYVQRARFANIVSDATVAVTSIVQVASTTVTVNLAAPLTLVVGQFVIVSGNTFWNGFFQVSAVISPVQFTFAASFGTTSGTGGTATASSSSNFTPQFAAFTTFKYFGLPGVGAYLLADSNGKLFAFDTGNSYAAIQRVNPYVDPNGSGNSKLNGPWSREVLQNIVYEVNGQVKQTGRGPFAAQATIGFPFTEGWGLDAPDVTPQIVINAGATQNITAITRLNATVTVTLAGALAVPGGNGVGMINVVNEVNDISFNGTFLVLTGSGTNTLTWAQQGQNTTPAAAGAVNVSITKSIGRSYAYAWENANKNHVGAPSPASQFIQYNVQNGTIQLIEQGTITISGGINVVGTGTNFSQAWVGRYLWAVGNNTAGGTPQIVSVTDATHMTLFGGGITNVVNAPFQIYDPQATHLRLYATADGGATYFRIQRNVWNPAVSIISPGTLGNSGLQFFDTANSEPPNFPFTTEISQLYNVPPPVGAFVKEYQSRLIVYGGTIPGQTFFYTNIESTTVGLTQESVAPLNQVTLPIQNANISGMADLPGSLIIWSDKQDMFRLTGLLSDNTPLGLGAANTAVGLGTQITSLPYSLGCANPFAVAVTPLGAIWVTSNRELWLYTDKYAPRNIGRPIQTILRNIPLNQLANVRLTYYHSLDRNWVSIALSNGSSNNVLVSLDLDLLASNGQASFFTFDMATNHPAFWIFNINCTALEVVYETGGAVRMVVGGIDLIEDADYQTGLFGTEVPVTGAGFTTQAWGNDSAFMLKRPTWLRFTTNQDPSQLSEATSVPISGFSVLAADSGHRANENPLNPAVWTPDSSLFYSSLKIVSNKFVPQSPVDNGSADVYTAISWPANQWNQFRVLFLGGGIGILPDCDVQLVLRSASDLSNCYAAEIDGSPAVGASGLGPGCDLSFNTYFGSSTTPIFSQDVILNVQANDVFLFACLGTSFYIYQNRSMVLFVADANVATGNAGVFSSVEPGHAVTDAAFDNFAGGGTDSWGALRVNNLSTIRTSVPHNLVVGQTVFISGVYDYSFNGAFVVNTILSPTSFTYIQIGLPGLSGGGTVSSGWSFEALGIDDDFYTFNSPLALNLIPGVNDSSTLSGNPNLSAGEAFRHSPELFKIGGVNFVMGRRIQFVVNFPSGTGVNYALRSIQLGFGPSPPR